MRVILLPAHGEASALVRGLLELAGGDHGRIRTGNGGLVVDEDLAYRYLAARHPLTPADHLAEAYFPSETVESPVVPVRPMPEAMAKVAAKAETSGQLNKAKPATDQAPAGRPGRTSSRTTRGAKAS